MLWDALGTNMYINVLSILAGAAAKPLRQAGLCHRPKVSAISEWMLKLCEGCCQRRQIFEFSWKRRLSSDAGCHSGPSSPEAFGRCVVWQMELAEWEGSPKAFGGEFSRRSWMSWDLRMCRAHRNAGKTRAATTAGKSLASGTLRSHLVNSLGTYTSSMCQ